MEPNRVLLWIVVLVLVIWLPAARQLLRVSNMGLKIQ